MKIESKIREFLAKDQAAPVLSEEVIELDEKASRPADSKDGGDSSTPSQGSSNASPEIEDMSGADAAGGLTSVNKAAAKAKKDSTLPKGSGAGDAPNFEDKVDPKTVVAQSSSEGVREEAESEEEVIVEDEVAEDAEVIVEADEALFAADVDALFADEENLSEEFKVKAAGIFEAVLTARIANEMDVIESELQEEVQLQQETFKSELVEKVDSFLNYVAENWMKENELAIERGLRTEITEDFISGMKTLFAEHYIEVPQDKYDVLGEMQDKIDSLETKLNESTEEKIALASEKTSFQRDAVIAEACADLTLTESDKLVKLVADIDFGSEEIFAEKIAVVKENYFPRQVVVSEDKLDDTVEGEYLVESGSINKYAQAISKSVLK